MVKKLQEILGSGYEITEVTTKKNNYNAHQVSIRKKGDSIAALFDYESCKIAPEGVATAYFEAMKKNNALDTYAKKFLDPDWMKEHVYIRLTSDAKYAENYVHRKTADLYMIPYVQFDEEHMTNIKSIYTETSKITDDEVFLAAMKNMDKECVLNSLDDIVSYPLLDKSISDLPNYMEKRKEDDIPMLVVTNTSKFFGAASIFCERVQNRLDELFPNGYYLVPSSIHEFIAVDKQILIPESLKEVIFDMNKNVVEKEEQLSDAAYYFENGILHKTIL